MAYKNLRATMITANIPVSKSDYFKMKLFMKGFNSQYYCDHL